MKTAFMTASILLFATCFVFSQNKNVDYNQFVRETQKNLSGTGNINIVWWIPVEFWDITLHKDKSLPEDQIQKFIDMLKPYSIFAVIDGEIGPFGGVTFNSVDSIRESIVLIDNDKINYRPIEYADLDPNVQNLIAAFKPILKNAMGQLGENMNFFVFTDKKPENKRVSDPYLKGNIQVNVHGKEYKWRTPLGTLLPSKTCPKDGEVMNGAWEFCPWDGEKLILQKN